MDDALIDGRTVIWLEGSAVPYVVHECRVMPPAKGRPKETAAAAK